MADIAITVDGGTTKNLLTAGKYCDRNIVVTATGGEVLNPIANPKQINFYDYDGTCRYSYTLEEAKSLLQLPPAPVHNGLIFQDWNYTLDEVKNSEGELCIGANYITSDGATRIYISISNDVRNTIPLYIRQSVDNGVEIDWGDGTEKQTLSGVGAVNTSHVYSKGNYVISLTPKDGCDLKFGDNSKFGLLGGSDIADRVYTNAVKKIEIGRNVYELSYKVFKTFLSLESVTIPLQVKDLGNSSFWECCSLRFIVVPRGTTTLKTYFLRECRALQGISMPSTIKTFETYIFQNDLSISQFILPQNLEVIGTQAVSYCSSIPIVTIPSKVNKIDGSAFTYCVGVKEFHLKPTIPPVLNSGAFSNISDDCMFYVPKGSLAEYQTATNWSEYSDKMQEEAA